MAIMERRATSRDTIRSIETILGDKFYVRHYDTILRKDGSDLWGPDWVLISLHNTNGTGFVYGAVFPGGSARHILAWLQQARQDYTDLATIEAMAKHITPIVYLSPSHGNSAECGRQIASLDASITNREIICGSIGLTPISRHLHQDVECEDLPSDYPGSWRELCDGIDRGESIVSSDSLLAIHRDAMRDYLIGEIEEQGLPYTRAAAIHDITGYDMRVCDAIADSPDALSAIAELFSEATADLVIDSGEYIRVISVWSRDWFMCEGTHSSCEWYLFRIGPVETSES